MEAIILTESQAAQLRAARGPNATRILEPRRLEDGRLVLNADVLDDPYFTDPSKPWAQILGLAPAQPVTESRGEAVSETGAPEPTEVSEPNSAPSTQHSALTVITLTAAELH